MNYPSTVDFRHVNDVLPSPRPISPRHPYPSSQHRITPLNSDVRQCGCRNGPLVSGHKKSSPGCSNGTGRVCLSSDTDFRSSSPPWVPPGISPVNTPKPFATPLTGTRRNRAVEHSHVFLSNPNLPPTDINNICWLYTSFDFKAHISLEQAIRTATHQIDRLVDKMSTMNPPSPPQPFDKSPHFKALSQQAKEVYFRNQQQGNITNRSHESHRSNTKPTYMSDVSQCPNLPDITTTGTNFQQHGCTPFVTSPQASMYPHVNGGAPFCKGHLIFDIISTRKHIGRRPTEGPPYLLGQEIYRYVDFMYQPIIANTFVGISDNTARRVGRDMYYSASDDLSKSQIDFSFVDNQHMFVVFPEINCLRIRYPESMVTIKKRQTDAEVEAFARAEKLRIYEEKEREARRPKFVVPHPPRLLGIE